MPTMRFTKMHGLGNDFVVVDASREDVLDAVGLASAVSDRHTGIGSDGLILLRSSNAADLRMEMYNADGSRAEMCGNGIRCVAKYAVEHGLAEGPEMRIDTDAGVKPAACEWVNGRVDRVRIDMGRPVLAAKAIPAIIDAGRVVDHPFTFGDATYAITCVCVGNPHAVVFVDDLDAVRLDTVGPRIEHAPMFPNRINAHFVRVDDRTHLTMKTWERGSGATRACGTGACAVCVAGALTHRTDRAITATLPGGRLQIEWAEDDHVYMTGPAVEVYSGEWPD